MKDFLPSCRTLVLFETILVLLFIGGIFALALGRRNRRRQQRFFFRTVATATLLFAVYYLVWRYLFSLNPRALWFAIPLVLAETYTFLDTILFALTMWKPAERTGPPPLDSASVDVYITTYNEPLEIVGTTVRTAMKIDWPGIRVYLLDDGSRSEFAELARKTGCGYITRGTEWKDKPRHAKAGNVNNALAETTGEFILILDADQIPDPSIVRKTIGYFRDETVAFVQTPQYFYNTPPGDPFGTDAPLFYGPILRGKDGWNAAFFCGSNAILRREALLRLGVRDYVEFTLKGAAEALGEMERAVSDCAPSSMAERDARSSVLSAIRNGESSIAAGAPVEEVFAKTLEAFAASEKAVSPCLESILARYRERLDVTRSGEAIPILPLATISVTEDMATSIRLHATGWKSVFHSEILAQGLAPEDLGSALSQRFRWAQGTIQVLVRTNPLTMRGLTMGQRLQYFTTIHSYFSGFASLIFVLSPLVYLFFGIAPVETYNTEFLWRLIPYLVLNRVMFKIAAAGTSVRRGEQYSLALFPVWIKAVISVIFGKTPRFVVTPKERQSGIHLLRLWPQLLFIVLSLAGTGVGIWLYVTGKPITLTGLSINVFWALYNTAYLLPIIRAAFYRPPEGWEATPPPYARYE